MSHPIHTQLDRLTAQHNDRRSTVFDVQIALDADTLRVHGAVLERAQHAAVMQLVQPHVAGSLHDTVTVLLEGADYGWAVVRWAVADLRATPSRAAELVTEARYGESVEVLRRENSWCHIRQSDGYLGWVSELALCSSDVATPYRVECTHAIATRWQPIVGLEGEQIGLLPWGVTLPVLEFRDRLAFFMSPDGVPCTIEAESLMLLADRPTLTTAGVAEMLTQIRQFVGVPYLWGGTSAYGFDCSGLAQAAYRWLGATLPRDADQQATVGQRVSRAEVQAGDLLFWAVNRGDEPHRQQNINHVSLALDNDLMIHANQRNWGISIDPINAIQANYERNTDPGLTVIRRLAPSDE